MVALARTCANSPKPHFVDLKGDQWPPLLHDEMGLAKMTPSSGQKVQHPSVILLPPIRLLLGLHCSNRSYNLWFAPLHLAPLPY